MNTEKIKECLLPVVAGLGYELCDVEHKCTKTENSLTVFIANETVISLDDCEKVHLAIDPVLDELNPSHDNPYTLNVSSPGLDRPFKTLRDYERNYNKMCEIKLYAPYQGKKFYEGILIKKDTNTVTIEVVTKNKKDQISFQDNKVVFVRPFVDFTSLTEKEQNND